MRYRRRRTDHRQRPDRDGCAFRHDRTEAGENLSQQLPNNCKTIFTGHGSGVDLANPAPADGVTNITVNIKAYDPSSAAFFAIHAASFCCRGCRRCGRTEGIATGQRRFAGVEAVILQRIVHHAGRGAAEGADLPIGGIFHTGLVSIVYAHLDIVSADSANLVLNYSFEIDNDEDGLPDVWRSYTKGFDYDISGIMQRRHTLGSCRKRQPDESRGVYGLSQAESKRAEDIELSGWSKAVNVSGAKDNDYALYVDVQYQDGTRSTARPRSFSRKRMIGSMP